MGFIKTYENSVEIVLLKYYTEICINYRSQRRCYVS